MERDRVREVISAVVRSVWASAQDWTVAWRDGTTHLKAVVTGLLTAEGEDEDENTNIPPSVHTAANQLASSVAKMVCDIYFVVVFMDVTVCYGCMYRTVIVLMTYLHVCVCVWLQEDCVRTMQSQVKQIQEIERMQNESNTTTPPLYSTLTLQHMG